MRTPKGRILCTQDDPDSRELIVYILQTADYHVTITADSPEALSLVQCEQFDLILVDNWMPGLSGQELTTEIRKFDKNTPSFFTQAQPTKLTSKRHATLALRGYLIKPLGISDLVDEVARLITEAKITFRLLLTCLSHSLFHWQNNFFILTECYSGHGQSY